MNAHRKAGHYWVVYGTERVVARYRLLRDSTLDGLPYTHGLWFLPGSSRPLDDNDIDHIFEAVLDDRLPLYRQWGFWISVFAVVLSVIGMALRLLYTCK